MANLMLSIGENQKTTSIDACIKIVEKFGYYAISRDDVKLQERIFKELKGLIE